MSSQFTVRFSGLCAQVPNVVDPTHAAASWSVLLPALETQFLDIGPHFAVVKYRPANFDLKTLAGGPATPDLTYTSSGVDYALIRLRGHRITFDLNGAGALNRDEGSIGIGVPSNPPPMKASLLWIPGMEDLLAGAGRIDQPPGELFESTGYPDSEGLLGHALIDKGNWHTSRFSASSTGVPSLWRFRRVLDHSEITRQGVAYEHSLEATLPNDVAVVRLTLSSGDGLALTQSASTAELSIENLEFEEVIGWGHSGLPSGQADRDFRMMYWFSDNYDNLGRAMPFFAGYVSGAGSRRRTCGGARFTHFDPVWSSTIAQW